MDDNEREDYNKYKRRAVGVDSLSDRRHAFSHTRLGPSHLTQLDHLPRTTRPHFLLTHPL